MKAIIWVTVGIIAGASASAIGQGSIPTWFGGTDLLGQATNIRVMYAAGADDMLSAVVATVDDFGPVRAAEWFRRQSDCLESRSGGRLGQLRDFADNIWRGSTANAASILLDRACN